MELSNLLEDAKQAGITHFKIAAAAVFEGRILLLKRSEAEVTHPSFYVFPTIEYVEGESINQMLQKALLFCTGLTLTSVDGYLGHFDYDSTRQCTFLVSIQDPYAIQLSNHEAYSWALLREAIGYPISDEVRTLIDRVIEKTNAP